jgi:hypothetical protein
MLLKELDRVAKDWESLYSLIFNLSHVSKMSHDLSQQLLVALGCQILR